MKPIKDEDVNSLIDECLNVNDEYEKVKFVAHVNGTPTVLSGLRLLDANEQEHFIVKTKNQGYYSFSTPEVLNFERVSVEYRQEEESLNPISKLQQTIVDKIKRDKEKTADESEQMADKLAASVGYFPLLKEADISGLAITFLDKEQNVMDDVFFPFVKGETYEVYSHEDERDIEISSLMVDVSLATDENGNDVSNDLFAKYYETYIAIQDLEFISDNKYTKEIFNLYKLDENYSKIVGDLSKHDLLELVSNNAKDEIIQEAAKELRIKNTPAKKDTIKFKR
jgi:hypothetical protein